MAKPKMKQSANKNITITDPETEQHGGDGWVVVTKQKVTILIPPLPVTEQYPIPHLGESPSQAMAPEEVDHITLQQVESPFDIEAFIPLATENPIKACSNPPSLDHRALSKNTRNGNPSCRKTLQVCSSSKARKHCGSLLNGHMFLNSKMRALNLDRKLQRAGGLNSWLMSLGLGQFVKIFRCKRVGKLQLVNLTMKKLKDMGADAVGPRRKLMHAIDCLWHANAFFHPDTIKGANNLYAMELYDSVKEFLGLSKSTESHKKKNKKVVKNKRAKDVSPAAAESVPAVPGFFEADTPQQMSTCVMAIAKKVCE